MSDFEAVHCIFNHTLPAEKLFTRPDWWFELSGDFAWYRCPECGLLFLNPRPTQSKIADYYPDSYSAYRLAIDDEKHAIVRWKRRRNLGSSITAVTSRRSPGYLLDVGCATGNYLAEMQKQGWRVSGVELQTDAADYARNRFGLDVFTGDLLESNFPAHSFDVVTLWDVLEHTHNPVAILNEIRRILKPEGLLIFSIPDPDSTWAQRFGPPWIGYDAPRHLYLFHGDSLRLLLKETNFQFEGKSYFLATYHTWAASFHTWLNMRLSPGLLRQLWTKFIYFPFWAPLTSPYFHRLNKRGNGTDMTIFARATVLP